jgi:hypothetical protein
MQAEFTVGLFYQTTKQSSNRPPKPTNQASNVKRWWLVGWSLVAWLLGRLALVGLVMQHPMSTIEFAYTDSHIAQNAIDPAVS